jgi:hypothetical protein
MYIANLAIANVGYSAHEAFFHGGGRYGSNASLGMRAVDFPRGYRPAEEEKAPDGRTSWRGEEHTDTPSYARLCSDTEMPDAYGRRRTLAVTQNVIQLDHDDAWYLHRAVCFSRSFYDFV